MPAAVVPPDSRYVPLVMQDYCAVPCCLSIAMLRRGLPLIAQELLAFHLGLTLPADKEVAESFFDASAHRTGVGGGVRPHEASFHPSVALAKLGIPLRFQFVPVSALDADQLQSLVVELTAEDDDRDVLFHFDRSVLDAASSVPTSIRGRTAAPGGGQHQQKHMCVLDRAAPRTCAPTTYRLMDPAVHAPKWREVDGAQLLRAMQALGEEQLGGLWLLHGRKNDESSDEQDAYSSPPHLTPPPTTPSVTPSLTRAPSNYEDVPKECSFMGLDRLDSVRGAEQQPAATRARTHTHEQQHAATLDDFEVPPKRKLPDAPPTKPNRPPTPQPPPQIGKPSPSSPHPAGVDSGGQVHGDELHEDEELLREQRQIIFDGREGGRVVGREARARDVRQGSEERRVCEERRVLRGCPSASSQDFYESEREVFVEDLLSTGTLGLVGLFCTYIRPLFPLY